MITEMLTAAAKKITETFLTTTEGMIAGTVLIGAAITGFALNHRAELQSVRKKLALEEKRIKHIEQIASTTESMHGNRAEKKSKPGMNSNIIVTRLSACSVSSSSAETPSSTSSINMNPPKSADRKALKLAKINAELEVRNTYHEIQARRKAHVLAEAKNSHTSQTPARRMS
jgi:hypothetical protein